jgi:NADH-quinone oxidoreductase subunit E
MASEETLDMAPLDDILDEFENQKGVVIPILQRAQEVYGYLPKEVLTYIAMKTGVPASQIFGVATFYSQFYLTRRGRHVVRQCDGTACHVRGAARIVSSIEEQLGIKAGETTPDYKATFEVVYCLGSCGLAPVAVVDGKVVGNLVPEKMMEIVRELE